ncbi:MAG: galactose-1-phosphate uridylyltransferase [Propionibacteriales bacterium]|nr:galactose-1-phosphate uridylyltransferase [Propionibacteriales bacterium]
MTGAPAPVHRHLSDGRSIYYYGEVPGVDAPDDERSLTPLTMSTSLRHDPLHDEQIMIAAHRHTRTHLPSKQDCPLCPSTQRHKSEIPASDYQVVVFDNRFPSFGGASGGACEVVCFTPDHTQRFADLSSERARLVIDAWADRTDALSRRDDVQQVFIFENRGEEIGVTLHHPHGQIYALPFVAPRTQRMLDVVDGHEGVVQVMLEEELAGPRVVMSTERWVAFVPEFARWPVELHIYPLRKVSDLSELDDLERAELALLYLDCLGRLDLLYETPLPYISAWHQAPVRQGRDVSWLRCEIISIRRSRTKLKYLAGSESAMNVFVNDVSPEQAADRLRALGGR